MNNLPKLKKLCADMELDGLMLTGEINRRYATGMHTSAGLVLVTPDRAFFSTDFRYIESARERLTDFEIKIVTRDETYHMIMAGWAAELRLKRIGFEEDLRTVKAHETWKQKLDAEWVSAQDGILKVRAFKEQWEIDLMEAAQRIAEKAYAEVLGIIKTGMTEREIAAELVYRMLRCGADSMSFNPIVVSGPNSSLPHGEPGDRIIQNGDFLTLDFGCVRDGYCSDMTRTVAIGHATDEMREVYGVVRKAQLAGIAAAKAGIVGSEIHKSAADVIAEAGYGEYFGHGFGHGIGLEVHEDYCASPTEKKQLGAGMVISAEPGIYLPGKFGVRIEDIIVIRENEADNLMNVDRELIVL